MGTCKKCGASISSQYLYCYDCNKTAKAYKGADGYPRFKDSNKSVHRWAWEKSTGKKLRPGAVIHHKDRDKTNNRGSNLWAFRNQDEHDAAHERDAERHGDRASYQGFKKKKGFFRSFFGW